MEKKNFCLKRKTRFISKYNYGKGIIDLGEFVLSYASSCNLGCEYCYLNFVRTPKQPVVYKNKELMFNELEEVIKNQIDRDLYINCGEAADSLLTDEHIKTAEQIIDFLSTKLGDYNKNITVEIRTKTSNIDKFKSINSSVIKVVYATSLMHENIRKNVETRGSNIDERINNLNKAIEKGMMVGLRFEPIIMNSLDNSDTDKVVKELTDEYEKLICKIQHKLSNLDKIHTISLSVIRFTREQFRYYVDTRSKLVWPEMIICPDGKYRYSRPIRIEIYKRLIDLLKKYFGYSIMSKIYLATEFDYIWNSCGLEVKKITEF
ncbi:MAG: spore photoproduct lyase family protein [Endomicrobiia bacterium]